MYIQSEVAEILLTSVGEGCYSHNIQQNIEIPGSRVKHRMYFVVNKIVSYSASKGHFMISFTGLTVVDYTTGQQPFQAMGGNNPPSVQSRLDGFCGASAMGGFLHTHCWGQAAVSCTCTAADSPSHRFPGWGTGTSSTPRGAVSGARELKAVLQLGKKVIEAAAV